jgi:hypothetical protein
MSIAAASASQTIRAQSLGILLQSASHDVDDNDFPRQADFQWL